MDTLLCVCECAVMCMWVYCVFVSVILCSYGCVNVCVTTSTVVVSERPLEFRQVD